MQKITVVGRAYNVEVKEKAVLFNVAVWSKGKADKDGKFPEKGATQWYKVLLNKQNGERIAAQLAKQGKGANVVVTGNLELSAYTNKAGGVVVSATILFPDVNLVYSSKNDGDGGESKTEKHATQAEEELPF